ncbi:putative HTH-type transcriptional regulator [Roseovarius sp. EC-HK134]|uniref:TetR-like C-terminal domain-containing protein n=1 Tax=Roseovarius TaxID=74030 RepID=UPI0012566B4B|nr:MULTISPECIES: TetR-like C-terminal domain-containing protein [Roseovarius]VVT21331.1 putative HTH-type transcriptional regulator [Roseovarius sp. EC-SD190]VVT21453.1 putative HTH-type transcriptional regulator [Roseovarius sp. EC-HK134]
MERNRSVVKSRRKPSGAAVQRADLTDALYRAFFEEWAERGFAAISLERVAARAGAGKAAIYRRFSSHHEFAVAAVSTIGLTIAMPDDHGSLEADVLAFLIRLRVVLRHPMIRRILPDLHAEAARSAPMRDLNTQVAKARREQAQVVLDRAIARGELDQAVDRDLALDLLPAPLYWRMVVLGITPTRDQLAAEAVAIVAALRASSPRC